MRGRKLSQNQNQNHLTNGMVCAIILENRDPERAPKHVNSRIVGLWCVKAEQ